MIYSVYLAISSNETRHKRKKEINIMNCEISLGSRPSKIPNLIIVPFLQKHVEIEPDYEIEGIFFRINVTENEYL